MNFVKYENKKVVPSKIVCVGKNYPLHIEEMGGKKKPSEPVIFIKANSAIASNPKQIFVPKDFGNLHHEVELCFMIGKKCKNISRKKVVDYISAFAVGIDFTLRDMQSFAKQSGNPWTISKSFDNSAVFGTFVGKNKIKKIKDLHLMLAVNDEVKQSGCAKDMIFSIEEIVEYTSRFMTLEAGDVFMTGTPHGVGEVCNGDTVFAEISGIPSLEFKVKR